MNASETARQSPATARRQDALFAAKIPAPAAIASGLAIWSSAAIPSAAAHGRDHGPAALRPLALERRALLHLLGVRADHCGRSFFVWRPAAARTIRGDATPLAGSDQQFAIAFAAGAGAWGAFQCEITSREAGGKVSVWHAGARLVGEFILLSAHQEEGFNEFLRRLEAARARGARYVEAPPAAGGAAHALAMIAPIECQSRATQAAKLTLRRAPPSLADNEFADPRSRS